MKDCNYHDIQVNARVKCYGVGPVLDGVVRIIGEKAVFVECGEKLVAFQPENVEVYSMSWTDFHEQMLATRR